MSVTNRQRLTNDYEVDILRIQLAPLHTLKRDVAIILLARGLVEESIKEEVREQVGVV